MMQLPNIVVAANINHFKIMNRINDKRAVDTTLPALKRSFSFYKGKSTFCTLQSVPGNQGHSNRDPGSSKNDNKFPVLQKPPFISVVLNHSLPSPLSAIHLSALLSHERLKTTCKKQ